MLRNNHFELVNNKMWQGYRHETLEYWFLKRQNSDMRRHDYDKTLKLKRNYYTDLAKWQWQHYHAEMVVYWHFTTNYKANLVNIMKIPPF